MELSCLSAPCATPHPAQDVLGMLHAAGLRPVRQQRYVGGTLLLVEAVVA